MALVVRPAKQGGFLTYAAKVAAGFTKILSAEMDADLAVIIAQVNGFLDQNNILAGSIVSTLLGTGSVITAKIADLAVTTAKLADLSVAIGKLAVGASVNVLAVGVVTTAAAIVNAEGNIVTLGPFTTRGGRVVIIGTAATSLALGAVSPVVTFNLYRDGNLGPPDAPQAIWTWSQQGSVQGNPLVAQPSPSAYVDQPAAGQHTYRLRAIASAGTLTTPNANAGVYFALELA